MKRYIKSANHPNKRAALRSILQKVQSQPGAAGYTFKINDQDGCIDILDPNGATFGRIFAESDNQIRVSRANNEYEYVGEGKGDYIKRSGTKTQRTFSDTMIRVDTLNSVIHQLLP